MQQDVTTIECPGPDLAALDCPQLAALRDRVDERVRDMRVTKGPARLQEFSDRAGALGLVIDELIQGTPKRRGRPPKDREDA
jgi:hypothetical protein